MSGEKILSSIREESEKNIASMKKDSEKKCREILDKADKAVKEIKSENDRKLKEQSAVQRSAYDRSVELLKRNTLLETRREEIDKTVDSVYSYMLSLNDREYFELIYKLAATLGKKSGVLFLNSKDMKRLPDNFVKRMNECGIDASLSDTPDDSINSGFILKNGDIEENMSFSSIIADKREEIEDIISRELFKD